MGRFKYLLAVVMLAQVIASQAVDGGVRRRVFSGGGGEVAPSFITGSWASGGSGSTTSVSSAATTAPGQFVIVFCRTQSTGNTITLPTSSATDTFIGNPSGGVTSGTAGSDKMFYTLSAAGSGSVTYTCHYNSDTDARIIVEVFSRGSVTVVDTSLAEAGSGASYSSSAFSTTGKDLIVVCMDVPSGFSTTGGAIGAATAYWRPSPPTSQCIDRSFATAQTAITAISAFTAPSSWGSAVMAFKYGI